MQFEPKRLETKRRWIRSLWILLVALFFGTGARADVGVTPPLQKGESEIALQIIASGMQGGGARRANMMIRDQHEWQRVWDVYNSTLLYKVPIPAVDFTKRNIVAVLLGEQVAVDRGARIVKAVKSAREIVVYYVVTKGAVKDSDGMTVSQTTQPFHFVAIDKPTLPVRFVKTLDSASENVDEILSSTRSGENAIGGDAGGTQTGRMSDIATASRTLSREDLIAIGKGESEGLRALADATGQNRVALNFVWILVCSFFALLMQAGLWMMQSGFVRSKNRVHTLTLNMGALLLGTLCFWAIGYGLMFGSTSSVASLGGSATSGSGAHFSLPLVGSVFSTDGFFLNGSSYDVANGALFLLNAVALGIALLIPIGALAERWTWRAFWPFVAFFSLLLFPIFGHWAWGGGWLSQLGNNRGWGCGLVDFAGGGTIHALGGLCALAGAQVLGARRGKFNADGSANIIRGASVSHALLGTLVVALGAMAFGAAHTLGASGVGGLRIGLIATSTLLCAASGGVAALCYGVWTKKRVQPLLIAQGTVGGVVAASACAAFVSPSLAVVVGAVAGIVVCWALGVLDLLQIDDVCGTIAVHGGAGLWGLLAVGLFADGTFGAGWNNTQINDQSIFLVGVLNGGIGQLIAQIIGCIALIVWGWGASFAFFTVQKKLMHGLRASEADEEIGLDQAELGLGDQTAQPQHDVSPRLVRQPVAQITI